MNLGTWDVTWERCPECPRPVVDSVVHDHVDRAGPGEYLIGFEPVDAPHQ